MSPEVEAVTEMMSDYVKTWAVCGGWALDLFLRKQSRPHKDVDLFIWRDEQLYAQTYFKQQGWRLQIACQGNLVDWQDGDSLDLPLHTIWARHDINNPGFVELLMNERHEKDFCSAEIKISNFC